MKAAKKLISVILSVLMSAGCLALFAPSSFALKVGDIIEFGTYPQWDIGDETVPLKNALSEAKWKSYDYYTGNGTADGNMQPGNWMQFADFHLNFGKYRAIKFTQYRPYCTSSLSNATSSYQDENGYILEEKVFYFKYLPIKWRVLDPSTGLVVCESIIDSQAYQNTIWKNTDNKYYQSVGSGIEANNYSESSIRKWLNDDFYNTAFNSSQMANIKSGSGSDPVFLLSKDDVNNNSYGFYSDADRCAEGTDYAKMQGLLFRGYEKSWWRLRSPAGDSDKAYNVDYEGCLDDSFAVNYTSCGIRPACYLKSLVSDTELSDGNYSSDTFEIKAVVSPADGGSVSGQGAYEKGKQATLTATPKKDYRFEGWYDGTEKISGSESFQYTVTTNKELTAKFESSIAQLFLYATTDKKKITNSGGNVSGAGWHNRGQSFEITASAAEGYLFDGWYGVHEIDGVLTKKKYSDSVQTLTIDKNEALAALFVEAPDCTVTVSAGEGGKASGGGTYPASKKITLTAVPDAGWYFEGWFDGETKLSEEENFTYTTSTDITISAKFEKGTKPTLYTLKYDANGGANPPADQTGNGNITLSDVRPVRDGYTFANWNSGPDGKGTSYNPGDKYELNKNATLYAVWSDNSGTSVDQESEVPEIEIKGYQKTLPVDFKAKLTFHTTIEAPEGYEIVWQDGKTKGSTFTINQAAEKEYKIHADLMKDGKVVKSTSEETVTVNTGFLAKIIAFFRGIFGSLPEYVDNEKM